MRKIRADLVGVVASPGLTLRAGDEVPEGIAVHDSLIEPDAEPAKAAPEPEKEPKASEATEAAPEPEEPTETAAEDNEDFSDILGGDEEPAKAPAKPTSKGRKPAAKRG